LPPSSSIAFSGNGYDLVATFDCLHDMGDRAGAAQHIRQALGADGSWLIVEPLAGDTLPDNLNPVGRVYYSFSTFLCVPNGSCASRAPGHSLAGTPWAPGLARRLSVTWPSRPVSPGSAARPKLRSTPSTRPVPNRTPERRRFP